MSNGAPCSSSSKAQKVSWADQYLNDFNSYISRPQEDEDLNYELGLRVQALESLLRGTGSFIDADQAHAAAHETVRDATKAAKAGSQDATNALAQLSQGVEGMSRGAQSSLLLDVLQQLTAASMGRPLSGSSSAASGEKKGLELWSSLPKASQET